MTNGGDDIIIICDGRGDKDGTTRTVALPYYSRMSLTIAWDIHGVKNASLRRSAIRVLVWLIKFLASDDEGEAIHDYGWKPKSHYLNNAR